MNTRTDITAPEVSAAGSLPADASGRIAESDLPLGHLAFGGFGIGGLIGAAIGAIAVGIAAVSTDLVLPGTMLHVAGPLSAALLGAGAGAANGGLVGALIGWSIPVERSDRVAVKASASSPVFSTVLATVRRSVRSALCPHCK